MTKLTEKNNIKIEGNVKNNLGISSKHQKKMSCIFFLIDIDFIIKLSYEAEVLNNQITLEYKIHVLSQPCIYNGKYSAIRKSFTLIQIIPIYIHHFQIKISFDMKWRNSCAKSKYAKFCLVTYQLAHRPPYTEGRERLTKDTDHSRLVGSRFNKQGNYIQDLPQSVL